MRDQKFKVALTEMGRLETEWGGQGTDQEFLTGCIRIEMLIGRDVK